MTHRIHGTGIFSNIYHTNQPNVGKYTTHGSYGKDKYEKMQMIHNKVF